MGWRGVGGRILALALRGALLLAVGCGRTDEPVDGQVAVGQAGDPLGGINGMTSNGLITNGLITNGLITNGLITNGLTLTGLSSSSFVQWFNANPVGYSDMVMRYLVACALPRDASLTWMNPSTQDPTTYTWYGRLGLTPGWAGGAAATEVEQELITACLAALVNKYGLELQISILGVNAAGKAIPIESGELTTFSEREACFFGNLFAGKRAYAGSDRAMSVQESTRRGCGLSSQASGFSVECPPMEHVGLCSKHCTLDKTKTNYVSCSYEGETYVPLSTRIRSTDVFQCGDGICQLTESCGTGKSYSNCQSDCGPCP